MAIRTLSDSVWMPYISLLILTFLNRFISVKTSLINTKLGHFVSLGELFLTMWIYRLVPSPSRFEIRQCALDLRGSALDSFAVEFEAG